MRLNSSAVSGRAGVEPAGSLNGRPSRTKYSGGAFQMAPGDKTVGFGRSVPNRRGLLDHFLPLSSLISRFKVISMGGPPSPLLNSVGRLSNPLQILMVFLSTNS